MAPAQQVTRLGLEVARRRAWTRLDYVGRSALGGQGPEQVSGHLCPVCAGAVEAAVGAIGPPALATAWAAHLRQQGDERAAYRVEQEDWTFRGAPGFVAWAVTTRESSAKPFEHIALDLSSAE